MKSHSQFRNVFKCVIVEPFDAIQEADINKLKLNKFERKRLLKGLQRSVPNFVMEKPIAELTKKLSTMQLIPKQLDEGTALVLLFVLADLCPNFIVSVEMFLEKCRLEKHSRKLKSMGIRCLADLELMEVRCFSFFSDYSDLRLMRLRLIIHWLIFFSSSPG